MVLLSAHAQYVFSVSFGVVWSVSVVHIVTVTLFCFHRKNCHVVDSRAGAVTCRKAHCQHPKGVFQSLSWAFQTGSVEKSREKL